jgi:hypothetical protein
VVSAADPLRSLISVYIYIYRGSNIRLKKIHGNGPFNLHLVPDINWVFKTRRMGLACYVECMITDKCIQNFSLRT